jgi:hypothetical protein
VTSGWGWSLREPQQKLGHNDAAGWHWRRWLKSGCRGLARALPPVTCSGKRDSCIRAVGVCKSASELPHGNSCGRSCVVKARRGGRVSASEESKRAAHESSATPNQSWTRLIQTFPSGQKSLAEAVSTLRTASDGRQSTGKPVAPREIRRLASATPPHVSMHAAPHSSSVFYSKAGNLLKISAVPRDYRQIIF